MCALSYAKKYKRKYISEKNYVSKFIETFFKVHDVTIGEVKI